MVGGFTLFLIIVVVLMTYLIGTIPVRFAESQGMHGAEAIPVVIGFFLMFPVVIGLSYLVGKVLMNYID